MFLLEAVIKESRRFNRGEMGTDEYRHRLMVRLELSSPTELDALAVKLAHLRLSGDKK